MNNLKKSITNALSANVAVLDETGRILAVNKHWLQFAENNRGDRSILAVGTDYLEICRRAIDSDNDEYARLALDGIEAVMRGERDFFSLEYPCHSPYEERWFFMQIVPLERDLKGYVVSGKRCRRSGGCEKPDLIVLDMTMPVMNGKEMLAKFAPKISPAVMAPIVVPGKAHLDFLHEFGKAR